MIKIEKADVVGWTHAIRGMRNPKNSWDRSDTDWYFPACEEDVKNFIDYDLENDMYYLIGHNDLELMTKLAAGGPVHAKYRRMIVVYMDITAPLYWWKEFDTYKVGTVANSCSTMHKIHDKKFVVDDFSHEDLMHDGLVELERTVAFLNNVREVYIHGGDLCDGLGNCSHFKPKDKKVWKQMIQGLPSTYNQKRTIMLNYEVLFNIYHSREFHKLDEWREFCKWIERLPYSEIITTPMFRPVKESDVVTYLENLTDPEVIKRMMDILAKKGVSNE